MLSEYIECIIGSWEAIALGGSSLLNFSSDHQSIEFYSCLAPHTVHRPSMTINKQFSKRWRSTMNLTCLSVCINSDYIIPIFGLPESAFIAMLILCLMTLFHYFYIRARTVLQCVLLVSTDQAACPPAPAIITLPALQSTAPASAGKVQYG